MQESIKYMKLNGPQVFVFIIIIYGHSLSHIVNHITPLLLGLNDGNTFLHYINVNA